MICCDRFFIFLSLAAFAQNQPFQKTALFFASLVKGEVLSPERIRANAGGIAFLPHPFRFSDTSVNNPSIVGSASHCNRCSPLHKGANCDASFSHVALNLNPTKTQCQSERTHVTSSTVPFSNPPPTAVTTIIHYSSFIIHHSLYKKSAVFSENGP